MMAIANSYNFNYPTNSLFKKFISDRGNLLFFSNKANEIYSINSQTKEIIVPKSEIIPPAISNIHTIDIPYEDYPPIENIARINSYFIAEYIYSKYLLSPKRVKPSIEGGIALIYNNKSRFFNKKELFIEFYNKGNFVIMLHKNYKKIIKLEEFKMDEVNEEIIHSYTKELA